MATRTSPSRTGRSLTTWAKYLESKGLRSREPALHRRLRRPSRAQRQPLREGDRSARRLRACSAKCAATRPRPTRVRKVAQEMAARWVTEADGRRPLPPRLRQARARGARSTTSSGTRILGLKLFPAEVMREEMAFYLHEAEPLRPAARQPQDVHEARLDVWTATLTGDARRFRRARRADLRLPQRIAAARADDRLVLKRPSAKQVGFQARSVVGGVFIPLLADAATVEKMGRSRSRQNAARPIKWAPLPTPPKITEVVPDFAERTPSPGATLSKNPPTDG